MYIKNNAHNINKEFQVNNTPIPRIDPKLDYNLEVPKYINDSSALSKLEMGTSDAKFTLYDEVEIYEEDIPQSLVKAFKDSIKDNSFSISEYRNLVFVASPTGNDQELSQDEIDFLTSFKEAFKVAKAELYEKALSDFKKADFNEFKSKYQDLLPSNKQDEFKSTMEKVFAVHNQGLFDKAYNSFFSEADYEVKVQLRSKTQEYLKDFVSSFKEYMVDTGLKSHLEPSVATELAKGLGYENVGELQKAIGAKLTGFFDLQTYAKYKQSEAFTD